MSFLKFLKQKWNGMSTGGKFTAVGLGIFGMGLAFLAGRNGRAKKWAELAGKKAHDAYDGSKPVVIDLFRKAKAQAQQALPHPHRKDDSNERKTG
jgi:hypothetical protein